MYHVKAHVLPRLYWHGYVPAADLMYKLHQVQSPGSLCVARMQRLNRKRRDELEQPRSSRRRLLQQLGAASKLHSRASVVLGSSKSLLVHLSRERLARERKLKAFCLVSVPERNVPEPTSGSSRRCQWRPGRSYLECRAVPRTPARVVQAARSPKVA